MPYHLGILATHPIQYHVPWFRKLAQRPDIDLTVFFAMVPDARQQGDKFGVGFNWDVPLLTGYPHVVLNNVSPHPGTRHFAGCDTPGIFEFARKGPHPKAESGRPRSEARSPRPDAVGYRSARPWDAFIVNGWHTRSCLQTLLACRRFGVPCVVFGDSNVLLRRAWHKRVVHRLLLKQYAAFLYVGQANRQFYTENGVPSQKLFFAPYAIDADRFRPAVREQRQEARRAIGIPEEAVCFLFCGKFEPKKRPVEVLKAFAAANKKKLGRRAHLLMVGDGALRSACQALARESRLPVTFAGFVNQSRMPSVYAAADCLLLPSDYWETWGLVVNEAMACGLPAMVSDRVGCHLDLIKPGKTGEIFPFDRLDLLAGLIRSHAESPEKLTDMGKQANRHVQGYGIEALVRGTLQAIRYVSRSRRPRRRLNP